MKSTTFFLLSLALLNLSTLFAVNITSIEQLDSFAEFSFALLSDNKGYDGTENNDDGTSMGYAIDWIKANDQFCLGVGDHIFANTHSFDDVMRNDPFFNNHFYPVIGDHDNETQLYYGSTGHQSNWGRGWVIFQSLNNFFNRNTAVDQIEFRQPQSEKVNSGGTLYDDQLVDYYAKRFHGNFTVHILGLHYGDSSVFAPRTKQFMFDKLMEIGAVKTDYDIVVVLAHANGSFVSQAGFSTSERDMLMNNADLICDASSHIYGRHENYDANYDGTEALWINTGCLVRTGDTRGYVNVHVFDNPPRFTMQFIDCQRETSRKLRVGPKPYHSSHVTDAQTVPFLKYVNGPYEPVNWGTYYIAPSNNFSDFVDQDAPVQLLPGQTRTVSIEMRNTGLDTWTSAAGHALGAINPNDNSNWVSGGRVALTGSVAPNQNHTFTFDITAPETPGAYSFQWRMVDDSGANVGFFGGSTPNIVVEVGYPPVNLIQNPSFEFGGANPDNWNTSANYSRSSEDSYEGAFSLKGSGSGSLGNASQTIALNQNTNYNISVRIKFLTGGSGNLVFDTSDKFDGAGQGQFVLGSPNNVWQEYSGSFNSGTETSVTLRVFTNSSFNGTFYVDYVKLEDPNVVQTNVPPEFTSTPPTIGVVGNFYTYTATGTDADGDSLSFSELNTPGWLSFNSVSAVLSGTPTGSDLGANPVSLRVSDGTLTDTQNFTIYVSMPGNDAPIINGSPDNSAIAGEFYSYSVDAVDYDGDTLSYSSSALPSWLTLDQNTGVISGTPTVSDLGQSTVAVTVDDGTETVQQSFELVVFEQGAGANLVLNSSFESGGASPSFWNPGGSSSASNASVHSGSSALQILTSGGTISQAVALESGVTYNISVWIDASQVTSGLAVFDTNDEYDGSGQGQFVMYGANSGWTEYTGSFTATDNSVTLRVFTDGTFAGTVYYDDIVISATSGGGANIAPVFTSSAITEVDQDALYSYAMTAADAEGDVLSYSSLMTLPSWLSLSGGVLSGTPTITDVGDHSISIEVSDGEDADVQNFTISVIQSVDLNSDDDNDGVPYILEIALGRDPNAPDPDGAGLPQVSKNGSNIDFSFHRAEAATTYIVEKSTDLINWSDYITVTDSHGAVGTDCTVPVPQNEMSSGKLFLRLKVEN